MKVFARADDADDLTAARDVARSLSPNQAPAAVARSFGQFDLSVGHNSVDST